MTPPPRPSLGARPGLLDLWRGLCLPYAAWRCIKGSSRLRGLSALCALVTAASLVGLVAGLWRVAPAWVGYAWPRPLDSALALFFWQGAVALAFGVLFVAGASAVPLLLLAPLQDPLSEATEALYDSGAPRAFSPARVARQSLSALSHTAQRVGLLLLGHALLLPLNLFAGAGSVLWTALGLSWTLWWSAAEYLSLPMARHLYPFSEVRRAMRARPLLAVGFGAAVSVTLWIPLLNLFLVPLAVVGGTLYFRVLRETQAFA